MFKPIEHIPLKENVYRRLRDAILNGELVSGERIYEARIAKEFGISRAPIREALKSLEGEGLIETRSRRGSYVCKLSEKDIWEVYSLRAALESLAFRLASKNITPEKVNDLRQIIAEMENGAKIGDIQRLSELDTKFHETVVRLSGHERLLSAWMSNIGQIKLLSKRVMTTQYNDLSIVHRRHEALLDALLRGSEDEITKQIVSHIESVAERILDGHKEKS